MINVEEIKEGDIILNGSCINFINKIIDNNTSYDYINRDFVKYEGQVVMKQGFSSCDKIYHPQDKNNNIKNILFKSKNMLEFLISLDKMQIKEDESGLY